LLVTVATPQLSAVVGVPNTTEVATQFASAEATMFAGAAIVGLVLSITVTVCVNEVVFPAASVAVQFTVVIPSGKVVGASFVTDKREQLSEAVGVPSATFVAVHDAFALTLTSAGTIKSGAFNSITPIVAEQDVAVPLASVIVYVNVFVPVGKTVPLASLLPVSVVPVAVNSDQVT
jgi:hypothetical protein